VITVGLTGSIAMGKSEVADIFRSQGIPVFDADREVHALYDSAEGLSLLQPIAPEAIIDGRVDRQALSNLVLDNPQRMQQLETIVHAEVAKRRSSFAAKAQRDGQGIILSDVPLLFEKDMARQFDVTIVVSAPEDQQRQRAMQRAGMTAAKLDLILKRQMPDAEKRRLATYVIINDGSLEELRENTLAILSNIKKDHRL
jgi:dephospho-CoA kinase